jgi:hypothetical protein
VKPGFASPAAGMGGVEAGGRVVYNLAGREGEILGEKILQYRAKLLQNRADTIDSWAEMQAAK